MLSWCVGPVVLLCLLAEAFSASHMKLNSDLQYDDLLMSADEGYFKGATTIETLKYFLGNFSDYFARAALPVGRQLSFGTVRLLVPRSRVAELKAAGYSFITATWESESNADVRINILGSNGSNVGTVLHSGECQDPGQYINMPGYLMKPNSAGKVYLTRLFAQHRWGVLPETGVGGIKFYRLGEDYEPIRCSQAIPGKFQNVSGGPKYDKITPCIFEDENYRLNVTSTCTFIPDTTSPNTFASIMADQAPTYGYVKHFCDNVADNLLRHSVEAETVHNLKCKSRSTAEVARLHADFSASGTAPSVSTPNLLLIEPPPNRKIVMVLDISGSMLGNRIRNLITAATRYVEYFVEDGAEVAVVSFNESVFLLQQLKPLTSLSMRQQVADSIRGLNAAGWTNIASAILKAMQILGATAPYDKTQTGYALLLTDGQQTVGPSLDDAIINAAKTSIAFDTVCISSEADSRMSKLAKDTGGWSMFASSNTSIPLTTELDTAFAKLAERSPSSNRSILLLASTFSLPMTPITMKVDESVTTSLNFMLSIPTVNITRLNVTVKDPNGNVYGNFGDSSVYEVNWALSSILIKIPDVNIVIGTWTVYVHELYPVLTRKRREAPEPELTRIRRDTSVAGSVVVVGGTTNSSLSVSVVAWLRFTAISQVTVSTVQKIYASVTNGTGSEITGASIQASVASPTGSVFVVSLLDDGFGFDAIANDGTYSGGLLPDQLIYVGDYSVTVTVLSPVSRVTSAGKFQVDALAVGSVTLPPGDITDVRVSMSVKFQNVSVQFTAPGNQAYFGTAGSFEVRASNLFSQVAQNFTNTPLLARLPGQPAGSKMQVTLWASNFTDNSINTSRTIYIAVGAVATSGVRGDSSFPTGALLIYPAGFTPSSSSSSVTTTTSDQTSSLGTTPNPIPPSPRTNSDPVTSNIIANGPQTTSPLPRTTPDSKGTSPMTPVAPNPDWNWSGGMIAAVAVMSTVLLAECIGILVIILNSQLC